MIDKRVSSAAEAVADIPDGATILVSGFGDAGSPTELIHALVDQGAKDLTLVNNTAGNGHVGIAADVRRLRGGDGRALAVRLRDRGPGYR